MFAFDESDVSEASEVDDTTFVPSPARRPLLSSDTDSSPMPAKRKHIISVLSSESDPDYINPTPGPSQQPLKTQGARSNPLAGYEPGDPLGKPRCPVCCQLFAQYQSDLNT